MSWQGDFYRRPLANPAGQPLWELLLCSPDMGFTYSAVVPQSQATAAWLKGELGAAIAKSGQSPQTIGSIQVFRPACVSLFQTAAAELGLTVEATRRVPTLKRWLVQRASWYPNLDTYSKAPYEPLALDRPAPTPLPEQLWGDRWGFSAIAPLDITEGLAHEPMPVRHLPEDLLPVNQGLASTTPIPGVVIDAGRQALALVQWLQAANPVSLAHIPGPPDGLILESGLSDRWVLTTFEDAEMQEGGQRFNQRQQAAQGLHFLLVRPDDSGMTYTGFWLLQTESRQT
jgi:hypothetical protein